MTSIRRSLLLIGILAIYAQSAWARQSEMVTITEPGRLTLSDLFAKSDIVILATVVSGDSENYAPTIYKAKVLESYKGATVGETIHFGPYAGERIGWDYVLFLQSVPRPIAPKTAPGAGYGTVHYFKDFDQGYTSMETSYQCVFNGRNVSEQCDYGVRVCTDYINLPKSTAAAPPLNQETDFGCRWVREKEFLAMLGKLRDSKR